MFDFPSSGNLVMGFVKNLIDFDEIGLIFSPKIIVTLLFFQ